MPNRESAKTIEAGIARPPGRRRIVSMRLILSVVTVSLIALSVIGFGNLAERNMRRTLGEEIENRLFLEARNLATSSTDALLTDFPELVLCPLVTEMQHGRSDLAIVAVLDHDQHVQGHLDLTALGQRLPLPTDLMPTQASQALRSGETVFANSDLLLVSVPARHANGRHVGTALVGINQSYIDEMVARSRQAFLVLTGILLVIGVGMTLLIMSVLLKPIGALRAGLERIGQGDLNSPIRLADRTELGLLAETVNGMAGQLLKSQAQMLERERLGAEMDLAHQMQHALLPEGEIRQGDYICQGRYKAAAEVGGDYYDFFELEDGKLGLVIADVSGKGLAGCLVTSMLAVLIRSLRNQHTSPRELLIALEKELLSSLTPGIFVTVFYGILDPRTGRMTFASAAHSPLAIYRAGQQEVEWHYTKGIPVGAMRNGALAGTLQDYQIDLGPGDVALQYTDGLNEAWNPHRQEQFEFQRIVDHMVEAAPRGTIQMLDELLPKVESWTNPDPLGDDFTLLAVERMAVPVRPSEQPSDRSGLADMLEGAEHLTLPVRMDALFQLRDWVESCLSTQEPFRRHQGLIESSLYEVCANIVEHGHGGDSDHEINLWWVPQFNPNPRGAGLPSLLADETSSDAPTDEGVGYFVICDQGAPFDPKSWTPPDLENPQIRRRGRGLGWQIVYSSMKKVVYAPKTQAGNLTLLRFDPAKHFVS